MIRRMLLALADDETSLSAATVTLDLARDALNERNPERVLISAHDSCDYSIGRMEKEVDADVDVLKAGATYRF